MHELTSSLHHVVMDVTRLQLWSVGYNNAVGVCLKWIVWLPSKTTAGGRPGGKARV